MRRGCKHEPTTIITTCDSVFGELTGPDYGNWWAHGVCEYRHCHELNCPVCGCSKGGWGPVGCPCQDWVPWHAMRAQPMHAAVKPSARRYRPSRRHRGKDRR